MVDTKQVSEKLDFNSEATRLIAWEDLTTFSSRKKILLRLLKIPIEFQISGRQFPGIQPTLTKSLHCGLAPSGTPQYQDERMSWWHCNINQAS